MVIFPMVLTSKNVRHLKECFYLMCRSHGQSRENINIPEDEIMGGSDRGIEEIGAASSQG